MSVRADELTPEKTQDIKALMRISTPEQEDLQVKAREFEKAMFMAKQQNPNMSQATMNQLSDTALKVYQTKRDEPNGLVDRLVIVYHNHFSHDEVRQILQFFDTPIGQKVKDFLAVRQIEEQPITERWMQEDFMPAFGAAMMEVVMKQTMPPPSGGPR
jgi:hypothetical protein